MNATIRDALECIEDGGSITAETALSLYRSGQSEELFEAAGMLRKRYAGNDSQICSIINEKQGACSENCHYCAQSSFWHTGCVPYAMKQPQEVALLVQHAVENGITRLALVTSGRALSGTDFETALDCFKSARDVSGGKMSFCASFGIITQEQLVRLKNAGVSRYHHNLETGRSYYGSICTTHSYDDRIRTILNAKNAGLEICSGGIIGMGETPEVRIELACAIRELDVQSVPVNILSPIPGTPFEHMPLLARDDILRTIAVFRFIMPSQVIRLAAGRKSIGGNGKTAFLSGANAMISGDFLTTPGSTNQEDRNMMKELGYVLV